MGDVDSVLVMSGRTTLSMTNTILGLVVMIGVDIWLIPAHGAVGAGIGWGAALAAKNLAGMVQVLREYGMHAFGRATLVMAALAGGVLRRRSPRGASRDLPAGGLTVRGARGRQRDLRGRAVAAARPAPARRVPRAAPTTLDQAAVTFARPDRG